MTSCAAMRRATAFTGGAGDDLFKVKRQGEIQDGETYDGGEGTDTLQLGAGVTLPGGVALIDIDTILYG